MEDRYKRFLDLVKEGDREKIVDYFAGQGLDPDLVRLNLDVFIQEELEELKRDSR